MEIILTEAKKQLSVGLKRVIHSKVYNLFVKILVF
jgi:hypothetical protein